MAANLHIRSLQLRPLLSLVSPLGLAGLVRGDAVSQGGQARRQLAQLLAVLRLFGGLIKQVLLAVAGGALGLG